MKFIQNAGNGKSKCRGGIALSAVSLLFLLSGCGSSTVSKATSTPVAGLTGKVYGGQQPVTGAQIQLYAAGTSGDGSSATALITQTVTSSDGSGNGTNSNANAGNENNSLAEGSFTLAGDYQCPSSEAEVYAVATGGNPGLTTGTNNKALALMAALGPCGNLSASTTITINELTTISSIASLAQFTKSYSSIGSGTSDSTQLQAAFTQVNEYANVATGTVPGPSLPSGDYASSTEIQTLGDAIASCVDSYGGTAGDGSDCGQLFFLATPPNGTAPTDTFKAALNIITNPTTSVCSIFSLSGASSAFTPTLPACPANWDLPIVPMTANPTFSVSSGTYTAVQSITISDSTSGATIYYTIDGTTPSISSPKYSSAIAVSSSETIQAIAVATGHGPSSVTSATYTINLPATATPTFSPAGGSYTSVQTVSLSDGTSGSSIYYTTNGAAPSTSSSKYTGPISVSATETIQAIAVASGYSQSAVASGTFTINLPTATAPTFSPGGGTYSATQYVTLSTATSSAKIYYTTDGSTPTTSSAQYSAAIAVSSNETIRALAVATGYSPSAVTSSSYTINIPQTAAPTFSPAGGTYTSAQNVVIADSTSGASIYYTTDGSTPTTNSAKYTGAISVASSETIQAIAVATGYSPSPLASASYVINIPQVATPTFSVGSGTYTTIQTVAISDSTSGATIYYTTNGSTPATSSAKYTGALTVSATETLQAIAVATGYKQSATASASYIINLPTVATPSFSIPGGAYTTAQTVALSDATPGAVIYYTTDGTVPTTTSTKYSTAIAISTTETLQAIAVVTGYIQSAVAAATYTMSIPKATLMLAASPNPQGVGEAVVITANVTVTNSQASTAGTFNIVADGNTICSGTTNTPTGYTCSVTTLSQGTHNLSATYVGTYNGGLQANAGPIQTQIWPVVPPITAQIFYTIPATTAQLFFYYTNANTIVHYTTDGSTPTCSTGTVYSNPNGTGVKIPGAGTVKAIGCIANYMPSAILIDTY